MKELIAIQSELKAPKGQTNKFGGYNYRSCEDILEALKPLLAKHCAALTLSDEIVRIGEDTFVKATATFYSSDTPVSVSAFARHPRDKKGMDDSQITGATSSYARKYALNGLFCIDDTRDADATNDHGKGGNGDSGHSGAGKGAAGKTTRPEMKGEQQGPAKPQKPVSPATAADKAAILLKFMESLGVQREEIEAAIGASAEEFTTEETAIVREAAKIMKARRVDFRTAISEVTR